MGTSSIPVISPDGVGDQSPYPGIYHLLSIGDGDYALVWISAPVDAPV